MSQEKERNLRRLAEIAARLPEAECALIAGIAKGMELSVAIAMGIPVSDAADRQQTESRTA